MPCSWTVSIKPWEMGPVWTTIRLGMLSGRAILSEPGLQDPCSQPHRTATTQSPFPGRARRCDARSLHPVLQRLFTGGGRTHVNLLFVQPLLIKSAPQGSAAPTHAWKVQHAGSFGRAGPVAGRPRQRWGARSSAGGEGAGLRSRSPPAQPGGLYLSTFGATLS